MEIIEIKTKYTKRETVEAKMEENIFSYYTAASWC